MAVPKPPGPPPMMATRRGEGSAEGIVEKCIGWKYEILDPV